MRALYRWLDRTGALGRVDPALYHRSSRSDGADLHIQYFGTAGFVIHAGDHTVLLDPYVSRPSGYLGDCGRTRG